MKLYLITRDDYDYDETKAMVVAAKSKKQAESLHWVGGKTGIKYIGLAAKGTKPGCVLESFFAG